MAGDGIEPPTQGFSVPRSTTELPGLERLEVQIIVEPGGGLKVFFGASGRG